MEKKHILIVLVENKSGVLNRVSSLFRRRKFNIDSLTVGKTEKPDISRMTIVVDGNNTNVDQVIKQLYKIVNVLKVSDVTHNEIIVRETLLIKVHATKTKRSEIFQFADVFRARALDISSDSLIFEITTIPEKINSFIEIMQPFGIQEMVRSGTTAINRGKK